MPRTTTCPKCGVESQISDSLVGRFVTCESCRCLYYVVAPTLAEDEDTHKKLLSVPAVGASRPAESPAGSASAPTPLHTLYARLQILLVLNLLIGAAVLVLELVRLFK
ncbi:MAG: hypothetical protein QM811_07725 [Pirellulales bacterium]